MIHEYAPSELDTSDIKWQEWTNLQYRHKNSFKDSNIASIALWVLNYVVPADRYSKTPKIAKYPSERVRKDEPPLAVKRTRLCRTRSAMSSQASS